ncbi:MAG: nucleotidyltransferase family protein [Armatimonadetes bacterium]|nr:nucleotidyltransferase family protein [Armatimonadota bacterium]
MATAILIECDQLGNGLAGRAPAPGLLPLAGRPLLSYAAQALRRCGDVDRILLSGPTAYRDHPAALDEVDTAVLSDSPLGDRLAGLLEEYGEEPEWLIWPANGPLIEPAMVEHFLAHAPVTAAATWAVVRESRLLAAFPLDWPVLPFAGEVVAWTGLGVVRPPALLPHTARLQRMLNKEANWVEAVKALGVGFAIKLKAGRASLSEVAQKLGELIGAPCVVQFSPYAELALRVRSRAEHHAARARLEEA